MLSKLSKERDNLIIMGSDKKGHVIRIHITYNISTQLHSTSGSSSVGLQATVPEDVEPPSVVLTGSG